MIFFSPVFIYFEAACELISRREPCGTLFFLPLPFLFIFKLREAEMFFSLPFLFILKLRASCLSARTMRHSFFSPHFLFILKLREAELICFLSLFYLFWSGVRVDFSAPKTRHFFFHSTLFFSPLPTFYLFLSCVKLKCFFFSPLFIYFEMAWELISHCEPRGTLSPPPFYLFLSWVKLKWFFPLPFLFILKRRASWSLGPNHEALFFFSPYY